MKKKVRIVTKRKKFRPQGILITAWFLSFVGYLASNMFITSHNAAQASEIQKIENEKRVLNESINSLSLSVKELSTRERIMSIVSEKGLRSIPDNVVSITR